MKKTIVSILVAGVLMFGLTSESNAYLAGKDLHAENLYQGDSISNYDVIFTVNPTHGIVELPVWGHLSVNVEDTGPNTASLTITEVSYSGTLWPSPNLAYFSAVTPSIPSFTDVTIGAASANWNDPLLVSFTDNTFSFDLGGLNTVPGDFVRLDITTSPVPVPASILLLGTGLAGLVGARIRRKKK